VDASPQFTETDFSYRKQFLMPVPGKSYPNSGTQISNHSAPRCNRVALKRVSEIPCFLLNDVKAISLARQQYEARGVLPDLAYPCDLKDRKCPPNRRGRFCLFSCNTKWTASSVLTQHERVLVRNYEPGPSILLFQKIPFCQRQVNTLQPLTR
jgi:hypothetical protein